MQKITNMKNSESYSPFVLSVDEGDAIIVQFDQEIFDFDEANQLLKVFQKYFPKNEVIATFKGQEIKGVIKRNEETNCNKWY